MTLRRVSAKEIAQRGGEEEGGGMEATTGEAVGGGVGDRDRAGGAKEAAIDAATATDGDTAECDVTFAAKVDDDDDGFGEVEVKMGEVEGHVQAADAAAMVALHAFAASDRGS